MSLDTQLFSRCSQTSLPTSWAYGDGGQRRKRVMGKDKETGAVTLVNTGRWLIRGERNKL